jgi:hypothetical protein
VVAIADDERERGPEGASVAEAGEHLHLVGLDLLARTAPVALLATPEIRVDRRSLEDEARRKPLNNRDERRAVRLARGGESQRHAASVIRAGDGSDA